MNRPARALLLFMLMALVLPYNAMADILRCGSHLIQDGDDAFSVIDKCGEPTQRMTIADPVYFSSAELWRYDRGARKFPALIRIVDGVVESIRFVKTPR
ncbi:MAG TPA: DUF2845 domain-containing protein [Steroidobacteraceae bacterium]|nr:DUF2845 domain-containing protein [Steroidobacteraceae bacterium]